jgi:sugar phosphate isomerase/epimerase
MNPISFMTANYVAREVGFRMTGWGHGETAVMVHFRPPETYPARFAEILDAICGAGFDHVDLWLPHLHPDWATPGQLEQANRLLAERGLGVSSLAGWFGATPEAFERCCRLAKAVGTRVLGGMTSLAWEDRPALERLLDSYDLLLAIENHPEKTPAELLEKIGGERIGACVDTGIWATQGYDAVQAIQELAPHIFHVHLKDVLHVGEHESCRYGRGIVPLERCVGLLREMGYTGGYSVEHEPHDYDPTPDVADSAELLRGWLAG